MDNSKADRLDLERDARDARDERDLLVPGDLDDFALLLGDIPVDLNMCERMDLSTMSFSLDVPLFVLLFEFVVVKTTKRADVLCRPRNKRSTCSVDCSVVITGAPFPFGLNSFKEMLALDLICCVLRKSFRLGRCSDDDVIKAPTSIELHTLLVTVMKSCDLMSIGMSALSSNNMVAMNA